MRTARGAQRLAVLGLAIMGVALYQGDGAGQVAARVAPARWSADGITSSGPIWSSSPATHVAVQQPELYVLNGVMLGRLWSWPHFPATIAIDNHDGFTNLRWTRHSLAMASAVGTYNYDLCTKSCAGGPMRQAPVTLVASHPMVCNVRMIDARMFASRLQRAYVYDSLSTEFGPSAGVPSRARNSQWFQPACKAGTR